MRVFLDHRSAGASLRLDDRRVPYAVSSKGPGPVSFDVFIHDIIPLWIGKASSLAACELVHHDFLERVEHAKVAREEAGRPAP